MNILILALLLVVIALLVFTNWHIFHLKRLVGKHLQWNHPPSIIDVVGFDLGTSLILAKKALGTKKKGSAFPLKIALAFHINGPHSRLVYNSWTSDKMIPEIIGALLEKEGWVVYKTPDCEPHEIMVDLPRSTLQKPE